MWLKVSRCTPVQRWLQNPNHYSLNCGFSSPSHTLSGVHFQTKQHSECIKLNEVSMRKERGLKRKKMPIQPPVCAESWKVGLLAQCGKKRVLTSSPINSQAYFQVLERGKPNTAREENNREGLLLSNLKASAAQPQPPLPSWSPLADLDRAILGHGCSTCIHDPQP